MSSALSTPCKTIILRPWEEARLNEIFMYTQNGVGVAVGLKVLV